MAKKKKESKFELCNKEYKFVRLTKEEQEEMRKLHDKPYHRKLPKSFTLRKAKKALKDAQADKRTSKSVTEVLHWAIWVITTAIQNRDMSVEHVIGLLQGMRESMEGKGYKMVEVQKKGE